MVPFDDQSPFVTSGIRLGTPALTTRGFGPDEFKSVVSLIDDVLTEATNADVQETVRVEVSRMCQHFPLYDFVVA